jgi:hypothetical protein
VLDPLGSNHKKFGDSSKHYAELEKWRKYIDSFNQEHCRVCNEMWPAIKRHTNDICGRCTSEMEKNSAADRVLTWPRFSYNNWMWPRERPEELKGLTMLEERLLALVVPCISVYWKSGRQRNYRGHCINIPQDNRDVILTLPRKVEDSGVIRLQSFNDTYLDLKVRRHRVKVAIDWLIKNNKFYKHLKVQLDPKALDMLPENDIPGQVATVERKEINKILKKDKDTGSAVFVPDAKKMARDSLHAKRKARSKVRGKKAKGVSLKNKRRQPDISDEDLDEEMAEIFEEFAPEISSSPGVISYYT